MNYETKSTNQQDTQARRGCCCGPMVRALEDARAILDRRYARGEITREQYETIKREPQA